MLKRGAKTDEPSTSSPPEQILEDCSMDGILDETSNDGCDEPPAKKSNSQDYHEEEEEEEETESTSPQVLENDDEIMVADGESRPNSSGSASSIVQEREEEEEEEDSRSPELEYEEEDEEDDSDSVFDSNIEVPEIDATFFDACESLKLTEDVIQGGWELYYHAGQRVLMEGDQKGWHLAAVYYFILSKDIKKFGRFGKVLTEPLNCTLNDMLDCFSISAIEFFDKMHRFIETIHSRKRRRYSEFVKKAQESLAVTTVIYKKFLKIFQLLFTHVSHDQASDEMASSHKVFELIWTAYLVIKRGIQSEDLISCHHLLFCVVDTVYTDICNQSHSPAEQHLNPTFVETILSQDITILRALCMYFDGVILDAKHFTEHVYPTLPKESIPHAWFLDDYESILAKMNFVYAKYLLETGQIDERIFIPTEVEIMLIFDDSFDSDRITRILRRGVNQEDFEDADFLNKVSVQNCLDKISLASEKNGNSSPNDVARVPNVKSDENEILRCPEDKDPVETSKRLDRIVGTWDLDNSDLKFHCDSMSDNPTATLLLKRDVLSEKFSQKIVEEVDAEPNYDQGFHANVVAHRHLLERLFMRYIEKIMLSELRKKCREEDLLNVLRREEFLDAVFCFCIELVLFSNGSVREFPWSAQICDLHPFLFHKVIDLMINHEKGLSRPMVQHFNQIEERIIEELAWKKDSPLWQMVVRCPLSSFNEFGEDWFEKGQSPLKFTPIKKRLATDDMGRPIISSNGQSRTVRVFMKRTYFTAALRLHDLCDRIGMGVRAKSQVWTLFDFVLRSETSQLMDRHLDQILMCCVYVVSKINTMTTTFMEIMAHYKRQPQALSDVYRKVPIDSKFIGDYSGGANKKGLETDNEILTLINTPVKYSHVDLIKYYNLVFRDRVKSVIHEIESAGDSEMTEMPVPTCYGLAPVKVNLSRTVAIQALPKTMHGSSRQELVIANISKSGLSYDVLQSPRKELQSINQKLSTII